MPPTANREDDLQYDVGNLMASDRHNIDPTRFAEEKESYLLKYSRDIVQLLINRVFALPSKVDKNDITKSLMVQLPDKITVTPRAKHPPKAKPLTKWEAFAKLKGITKKKRRPKLVEDVAGNLRPRYGAKGVNQMHPIVPAKEGEAEDYSPFMEALEKKNKRVQQQKRREAKNYRRQVASLSGHTKLPATINVSHMGMNNKKHVKKPDIMRAFEVAQRSTASIGKYDKRVKGEKNVKVKAIKEKVDPLINNNEKDKSMRQLKLVMGKQKAHFDAEKAGAKLLGQHFARKSAKPGRAIKAGKSKRGFGAEKKKKR